MEYTEFAAHEFSSIATAPFSPTMYSHLKFGSDLAARKFGYELADKFYAAHSSTLLSNRCIVIPSPYNYVKNAATVMTKHFVNRINDLLVSANGAHVEFAVIPRKVSYISDYGYLTKETRKALIDGDQFYMNAKYLKGRTLIFIDDVKITGTHEDKLVEILKSHRMKNDAFFLYFAKYTGTSANTEAELNFHGIKTLEDYAKLSEQRNHQLIVRPIKFLLSRDPSEFNTYLNTQPQEFVEKLYYGCLNEGYYKIPDYQANFGRIRQRLMEL